MSLPRLPRPATVLAFAALVISLTGSAIAAKKYLITSTSQIKPSVLAQLKGNAGPAGPKGDTGQAGAKGDTGATGLQGPKGDTGATGANGTDGTAGSGSGAAPLLLTGIAYPSDGTLYCGPSGSAQQSFRSCDGAVSSVLSSPMPSACTLQSLRLFVASQDDGGSPAGSHTLTATVMVNGAATALAASATSTATFDQIVTGSDLTDTVAVSAGDRVALRFSFSDSAISPVTFGTGVLCA